MLTVESFRRKELLFPQGDQTDIVMKDILLFGTTDICQKFQQIFL